MIHSKSRLAIELSKLKVFGNPDAGKEQYPTDSEIAADALWNANYQGDIEGKTIADFGAGTGILGIGALLIGARMVYFIEKDEAALEIAKENLKSLEGAIEGEAVFIHGDVQDFNEKVDIIIQNPPFGTNKRHADREFLMKAFETAHIIYSFHKTSTKNFVMKIADDNNYRITHNWNYAFPIKATQLFHKKKIHRIRVGCWRMERVTLKNSV